MHLLRKMLSLQFLRCWFLIYRMIISPHFELWDASVRSPRTVPAPSSHLFLNAPKHTVEKSKKIHQSSHLAIRRSWPCRRWRRRGRRWCSLLFPTWYELKTTSILGAAVRPAQPEHLEEEGDGSEEEEPQGGCEEEQEDEDCGINGRRRRRWRRRRRVPPICWFAKIVE